MWKELEKEKPSSDGKYKCLIRNGDREFEAVRMFKKGYWFGGCRPFTDNEVILKWKDE